MKDTSKTILYFARTNGNTAPGILNKIQQTIEALNDLGHSSQLILVEGVGDLKGVWNSMWKLFFGLFTARADIIIIRIDFFMPLLAIGLAWQRYFRGCRIIADVPTPIHSWIEEIKLNNHKSKSWRIFRQCVMHISFPWSLCPAHKIIQYAPESRYFSIGLKKKIKIVGNGVNVKRIPQRSRFPKFPGSTFVMIGVASLAEWHAFDRVIRGMSEYIKNNSKNKVLPYFYIVGDGPVRNDWENLCVKLGIASNVTFTGFKTGLELDSLYNEAHIGISSLGLYKAKLDMASSLKSREYAARGIPFVNAGLDLDFYPPPGFVYLVENNSSIIDISKMLDWYSALEYNDSISSSIRLYAEEKLDFRVKAQEIIM